MVNLPKLTEKPIILYEVIRVIDHIPLFLDDHLDRLSKTAESNHIHKLPEYHEIRNAVFDIINDENRDFGNIKITFTIKSPDSPAIMEIEFIPHFYPSEEKYKTGVKVGILKAERPNPQAKIQNMELRNKANFLMSKEKVFEVLLVDKDGNITEGSRSNVFFVKENQLYTSPDEKVLQGITRKKIVRLCVDQKIPLITKDIPLSEIPQFEGVFLTGSSPKVLPISAIEEVKFDPGLSLIKQVICLYNNGIEEYVKKERDKAAK
jgi:branched-chain amino acid aminotransferase